MPVDFVNRVNSRGVVVGRWSSSPVLVSFTDSAGSASAYITPPTPTSALVEIPFATNPRGGIILDAATLLSMTPAEVDFADAFAAGGLRFPLNRAGAPISSSFVATIRTTTARVRPSWWSGAYFTITEAATGTVEQTIAGFHFLADFRVEFTSVERAYLYNRVWVETTIGGGEISFSTLEL